jgi:hypothetical protein
MLYEQLECVALLAGVCRDFAIHTDGCDHYIIVGECRARKRLTSKVLVKAPRTSFITPKKGNARAISHRSRPVPRCYGR